MKDGVLAKSLVTLLSALPAVGLARAKKGDLTAAWSAWEAGEIARARALAADALAAQSGSDEARHLLFLTAFVSGDYRGALDHYQSIDVGYRRLKELTDPVIEACVHLGALADAVVFALGRTDVRAVMVQRLEEHARRPFGADLAGVTAVPFADARLGEWFPAFDAQINGQALTAHVDTGGSFLHMGPDRARALGIKTVTYGTDRAHLTSMRVAVSYGIAERFVLGDAVLRNVPVDVLDTLTGDSDLVIFGTNLLERFLATMDYPARRLLLSKRGDLEAVAAHRALLPVEGVNVPFHLWGSHQMFARGGLGARNDLNWFVDSGLVSLHPDGIGGIRQASFTSSKRRFNQWGISGLEIRRGYFESPAPLRLGPLVEERPLMVVGAAGDQRFGGVRIDGLISHAFLKRFVWTIDFDTREYRFA
jgi:predicted aspartyl protease